MNTQEKCEAILKKIVFLVNNQDNIMFESDMGDNTLTINIGKAHTHVGIPDGSFELLINNLYDSMHGGPGLSWVKF